MRSLVGVSVVLVCVAAACITARAEQGALKPPDNNDCLACHGDSDAKRATGSPTWWRRPPSVTILRGGRLISTAGLTIGIVLFVLILYAVVR